jgi:hypothetical protein
MTINFEDKERPIIEIENYNKEALLDSGFPLESKSL